MPGHQTLRDFLDGSAKCPAALRATILAVAKVSAELSGRIARDSLEGAPGMEIGENSDGDRQKALDVEADQAFAAALATVPVRWLASEERETVDELDPGGCLAVAIDPLDGSSNIDVNVSIGTIFSILDARETGDASFLRPGREQIAAGYVIYGPHTALILTLGDGARLFLLDPGSGEYIRIGEALSIAPSTSEFAINVSNYRHWDAPVRAFIDDCFAGTEGPRGKNFNMRWIASLVAEAHRILVRGGIFLYPRDDRKGYERGRLRQVYECAPIAFLVEQAGGKATDGRDPILDQVPASLHARTPFVFGASDKVDRIAAYHDLPEREVAPLFGKRGLFRT
jgi:fructose-1,6-bisphosphatase I